VELIAMLRPLRGLNWSLSATWQETTDRENPGIAVGYSPRWLIKSQLSYRREEWTGGLSFSYVGSMEADWQWVTGAQPGVWERIGDPVDDYLLVDANLRYDFPGRGPYANLHVGNLLDADARYPANELVDFRFGAPGLGRLVLLTLGWKF
jgi:outer membrane receptor protein involved in Fe transport